MWVKIIIFYFVLVISSACNPDSTPIKNNDEVIFKISSFFKRISPVPGISFTLPCSSNNIIGLVSNPILKKIKYRSFDNDPQGIILIRINTNVNIKASESGIVSFTGRLNSKSQDFTIEIIHKGIFKTHYSGIKSHNLTEGVFVKKGKKIGVADKELGFAIYIKKSIIDPDYISDNSDSNSWIDLFPVGLLFGVETLK